MDFSTNTSSREDLQFQAQRNLLRQFMILKDEGQVSSNITMTHMKNWLIAGESWQECQDVTENESRKPYLAELTWYLKRRRGLDEMEEGLRKELNEELRLSQQFGRKITMEGLQMFVQKIRPAVEEDVQRILLPVYAGFPNSIMVVQEDKSGPENPDIEGSKQTKSMFLQGAEALFPEVVTLALKHLLENRPEAASTSAVENRPSLFMQPMIARFHSVKKRTEDAAVRGVTKLVEIELLCHFGNVPIPILAGISKAVSGDIVRTVYSKFEEASKSFNLIGFDGTAFGIRDTVRNAVWDMTRMFQKASRLPVIPKQSVVLDATIQKVITEVLLQINSDTFANKDINCVVSAIMGNVFKHLNPVPWVQVTAVEELANVLLQSTDFFKLVMSIVTELMQMAGSWDNLKIEVENGHLDKHISYIVAINILKCVPDKYSIPAELKITQRIMESVKIPIPIVIAFENNNVEDSSAANEVDNTQKQGFVQVHLYNMDCLKEKVNFLEAKCSDLLLDPSQVKYPEQFIKNGDDVTCAQSSEKFLKNLDWVVAQFELVEKENHVKAEAAKLALVSVDTQADQTIKPCLASEPTELKDMVDKGTALDRIDVASSNKDIMQEKKPEMSFVSASEDNNVEDSSDQISKEDKLAAKENHVKSEAAKLLVSVDTQADETIRQCLASEPTDLKDMVDTRAQSSVHEEFLKQLDQISKEDKLAAKENHVKDEAAKLLVSVDIQTDQTMKPHLATEPTELKDMVDKGTALDRIDVASSNKDIIQEKNPGMSLVCASADNNVKDSSDQILKEDKLAAKENHVKPEAAKLLVSGDTQADETIRQCLASEPTDLKDMVDTRAQSSVHEEFLKQLDQISKEDKLAAKENHVKDEAAKLLVSVDIQADQTMKPHLATEPTELKDMVDKGTALDRIDVASSNKDIMQEKKPEISLVCASEDNNVKDSSDQISKEDKLAAKENHVKSEAAKLLVSVDTQADQTIKSCLVNENTEHKLEVSNGVPSECSENGHQLQKKKKEKKGGICGFFRRAWKVMTCSTGIPNEEE